MRNVLKICDLGTAIDRSDAATAHTEITPYLVSRFYRAPEIMLGMPYDYAVDMWSIGCTLYEMYTGKILFTGDSNNQMLKAIMEIRGKFSPKLHKRGQLSHMHFDDLGNFVSIERDKVLDKVCPQIFFVFFSIVAPPARNALVSIFMARSGSGFISVVHTALSAEGRGRNWQDPSKVYAGNISAVRIVFLPPGCSSFRGSIRNHPIISYHPVYQAREPFTFPEKPPIRVRCLHTQVVFAHPTLQGLADMQPPRSKLCFPAITGTYAAWY